MVWFEQNFKICEKTFEIRITINLGKSLVGYSDFIPISSFKYLFRNYPAFITSSEICEIFRTGIAKKVMEIMLQTKAVRNPPVSIFFRLLLLNSPN